ncbi:lactamase [Panaeolus papilionaceus]|nr:lactamase [Panaeolus papilionaceus]
MAAPEALPNVTKLSDHVVRVLGQNPGKFTLQGTNTYLIGSQNPYILIDTAEGKPEYTTVLTSTLEGVCAPANPDLPDISDIIISHWHGDHVGGIPSVLALLRQRWEARNPGKPYVAPRVHKYPLDLNADGEHKSDYFKLPGIVEGVKKDKNLYTPAPTDNGVFHNLHDGQTFQDLVSGSTLLRVLHTPGHTVDSISLYVPQDRALYTADTVLGHGTAVFEDLATYLASLNRMLHYGTDKGKDHIPAGDIDLNYVNLYPAHGAVVINGRQTIETYIKHRLERETQVLKALASPIPAEVAETEEEKEHWSTWTIVKVLYKDYPDNLWLPAARGIDLHMRKLEGERLIQRVGGEGKDVRWKLLVSPPRSPSL